MQARASQDKPNQARSALALEVLGWVFLCGAQRGPKSAPRAARERPRVTQERPAPRGPTGRPGGWERGPGSAKIAPKSFPALSDTNFSRKVRPEQFPGAFPIDFAYENGLQIERNFAQKSLRVRFAAFGESAFRIVKYSVRGLSEQNRLRAIGF